MVSETEASGGCRHPRNAAAEGAVMRLSRDAASQSAKASGKGAESAAATQSAGRCHLFFHFSSLRTDHCQHHPRPEIFCKPSSPVL